MSVHQLTVEQAIDSLHGDPGGLTSADALKRLAHFGLNRIERVERTPIVVRLLHEFTHFFAVILWVAALLAFVAEHQSPGQGMLSLGVAIVAVVIINGLFSFWQAYRAEEAFRSLQQLLPQQVIVLRDGAAARMAAEALVPGDVILVEAGDRVPADCRVIQSFALRADLSTVTGESHAVARDAAPSGAAAPIHSSNTLLAGTTVVAGNARALVFSTGMRTEFGRIARLAQTTEDAPSPLQRELATLSRIIAVLAVAAGLAVFATGVVIGMPSRTSFIFAIGIIVANVPEGLLPTLTLSLAMASRRLAARNVVVRKLASVETLGAASVICTDKTGTLTENRMAVRAIYARGRTLDPAAAFDGAVPMRFLECARACHSLKDAGHSERRWLGDPMEIALVEFAAPLVPDPAPKVNEIPFDSDRRRLLAAKSGCCLPVPWW